MSNFSMNKDRFSVDLIQKIKDAVNIVEVVGEHVVLRKTGANHVGLCPFHSERTPSFSVNENRQLYHCYGCKRGGDLLTFVMEILGLSFAEAIEELADRARVALPQHWSNSHSPEQTEQQKQKREKTALAFKLNRFVAAYFHQQLAQSSEALHYLKRRGVAPEAMKAFYVGAALDSWHHLSQHLERQKAPLDLAVELGLIRPSQKNNPLQKSNDSPYSPYFDLFRHRVLFPIVNLRGKIAGFGGRVLGAEESPKYLNSPESLVFQKSKLAFGLFQAQKHIREKDEVILVEGYFDVLALHAAGFQNAVATCGTSLTVDHLQLLKRFASKITVLFDGDSAGISATQRAMEVGLEQGWVLHTAELPRDLDPDEILFHPQTGELQPSGIEQMQAILGGAQPILDLKLNQSIEQGRKSPEDQVQALKQVASWLALLNDSVGREVRVQYVSKQLGVSQGLVLEAVSQKLASGRRGVPSSTVSLSSSVSPSPFSGFSSPSASRGGGTAGVQVKNGFVPQVRPQLPGERVNLQQKRGKEGRTGGRGEESRGMTPMDRVLVQGFVLGGSFWSAMKAIEEQLPQGVNLKDLVEYPPAQAWVEEWIKQKSWTEGQASGVQVQDLARDLDSQVREVLTEVLVGQLPAIEQEEFQAALKKCLSRQWARFSQRLKAQISQAALRNDAELQTKLMKEYLDVQRKMKDFNNFYDEA